MTTPPTRRVVLGAGLASGAGVLAACSGAGDDEVTKSATPARSAARSGTGQVEIDGTAPQAQQDAYRAAVLAAVAPVERLWGRGSVPATVQVSVPATAAEFDELTSRGRTGDADVPATTRPDGRVVIHPQLWERTTAPGRQVVITHELTHVALGQGSWTQVPPWVVEGSAEFTAYRDSALTPARIAPGVSRRVRAGERLDGPPSDAEVAGPDGYGLAWAWCRYLVVRHGTARFTRFVRAAGRGDADATDREFRAAYGRAPQRMASGYSTWLASWE